MKIAYAKVLFETGALDNLIAVNVPMSEKWQIVLHRQDGKKEALEKDRGGIREFKTLDAAYNTAGEIGFKKITVERD